MTDEAEYEDGYFVVRDGLKLHYRDYPGSPRRPPLLCLPGLTRNVRDFEKFAELYSPRFRVLALDFRGRGESDYDPLPARYNPLTYVSDVLELLQHAGIAQAIFVGTSLGGLVTMAMASMAPDRIAAAILNDVGPELNRLGLDRIQAYVGKDERFGTWEDAGAAIASNQAGAFPDYGDTDWIAMAGRNCRERDGAIRFDYDPAIAVPFQAPPPETPFDWWPLFRALSAKPLLVIRGELSDLLSAQALERMQAEAPQMQSVTVPGVGHAPLLNEPEAEAAIDAFFEGLQN